MWGVAIAVALVWPCLVLADQAHVVGPALVVDGDTFDIGETRIRLHGIDAAEMSQRCRDAKGKEWRCGRSGARRLNELVAGKIVNCEALDVDFTGRVVARCKVGKIDLGKELVEEGLAWAFVRYSSDYLNDEEIAKAKALGIWAGDAEPPWTYRSHRWEVARQQAPKGCTIKGNISRSGEKIYHPPWSSTYAHTRVSLDKGERWFCSEEDARAAGFREAHDRLSDEGQGK